MKTTKLLLQVCMVLLTATSAFAQKTEIDGIWYRLISKAGCAEVTSWTINTYQGDVVIPETVQYEGVTYQVTGIDDMAFMDSYALNSLTLPASVTKIGNDAFSGCTALASIGIPDNHWRVCLQ